MRTRTNVWIAVASDANTEWLDAAIDAANAPTLACVLVHLTGERTWIDPPFRPTRIRGLDDNDSGGLPPEAQRELRQAAHDAIQSWLNGRPAALPEPPDDLLLEMMSVSLGETVPTDYVPMIKHELQLDGEAVPAAGVQTHVSAPAGFDAIIIGAGISGLCAAVELAAAGVPYRIVERSDHLGGVWFENRYPGAACDVPSHLYSFSFAPYSWSRFFADSQEIHRYLEQVADAFDIQRHILFGLEVTEAHFDEKACGWRVEVKTREGARQTLRAKVVVSGVGAFNKPRLPGVPGLDRFEGESVHTARYPEGGVDLQGRKVILVGNGASAMQVAPAIVDEVASLTIVQRSPQWVAPFPKFKQAVPAALQTLLQRVPLYRLWYRLRLSWAFNDKLHDALQQDPAWDGGGRSVNAINDAHRKALTKYISSELGEDNQHLLPAMTPKYPPFGKRMLLDNGWYRALARDNVEIVNASVTEVRPQEVVTSDGVEREADVIIWATGFDVVNFLAPMKVVGRGGRELHVEWDGDDAKAYLGTVVPGFPNFFCLYGPNTQFGHGGSLISVLERQMHYVMAVLNQMISRDLATVDVRRQVYDEHNARVDAAHAKMVWTYPGVDNYAKNSKGRVTVNNPFRVLDVWRTTETADLNDFVVTQNTGASSFRAVGSR